MVRLVLVPQAADDLDGFGNRRRLDDHGLEAPFQGAVLLDVLAVLVEGGRADGLDLTARERGFEHVGRVDGAFSRPRTDQRVQLVQEQHDVLRLTDLLHDRLQALLELAAILRAGHQRAEVELEQALVGQHVRDLVAHDALGEALDDGGLAHAGLADQHRVVLGPPGEDLDDPLDLLLAPDDGIELRLTGELGQVAGELVEHGSLGALLGPWIVLIAEQGQGLLPDLVEPRAERFENLGRDRLALFHQAEQQVLGTDVVVAELPRFLDRQLEDALRLRSEWNLTKRQRLGESGQGPLDFGLDGFQSQSETLQDRGRDPFAVSDQAEENMLGSHEIVAEPSGFFTCEDDDPSRPFGESLKHEFPPPLSSSPAADFSLANS